MKADRAREVYVKLLALAARPGTPAEGEQAAKLAAELKAKFGFDDQAPPTPEVKFPSGIDFDDFGDLFRAAELIIGALGLFRRPDADEGALSVDEPSFAFRRDEFDDGRPRRRRGRR